MHNLFSPEFWAIGAAEHIRDCVLLALSVGMVALASKVGCPKLTLAHLDKISVFVVRSMAAVLVILTATGCSPLLGEIWYDLPMGAAIAGVYYLTSHFGPGVRLVAISPLAMMVYAAIVCTNLGMQPTQVAYGIMACYSIFMAFCANLLLAAILVSSARFGVPESRAIG